MSDRRKKNRYSEEDDGRVIAPMNVEGMPWYAPKPKTPKSSAPQDGYSRRYSLASAIPASTPSAFAVSFTRVSIRVISAFSGVRSKPISVFRSMPSARASAGSSVTSGYDAPCSHLLTAGALTPSRSASCSCVMPSTCLCIRMVSFMFSIGHAPFLTSGL